MYLVRLLKYNYVLFCTRHPKIQLWYKGRAMDTGNMHKKFGSVIGQQKDKHSDYNI